MGKPVIIYGKSGSGKSRSLKNFAEDEILFVNVEEKGLPFRKKFKYTLNSDNYKTIKEQLSKMPLKTAVIDDAGYLLTNMFMKKHSAGLKGNAVFDLYNDIGDRFWDLIKFIKKKLPSDVIVYIVMHDDSNDAGEVKLKTIGKLLDEKVNIQGMVTIVLRCMSANGRHFFRTHTDGLDITKSPEDMFENDEIDNDLKAVDSAIREYYEL
ncbi:MAG: AAA family ATPase [Ruminococcus sp.]|nr:AAA family ATPase [Ruminococcus sp.]